MRRSRLSLAVTLSVATATAVVALPTAAGAAPSKPRPVQLPVQLVAMNDFHGRIAETEGGDSQIITGPGKDVKFGTADDDFLLVGGSAHVAQTVDEVQAAFTQETGGESFFVGAGDLISASTFESSFFKDEPTVEVLNAMGLDVSSVGNHEFDRGTEELRRVSGATDETYTDDVEACPETLGGEPFVIGTDGCFGGPGHEFHGTDFPYLAANVISRETGEPMLPPYEVLDVGGGRQMAVIGVVTDTTPTIVSPDGVTDVDFIDEAEAVNRYIPELRAQGIKAIAVLVHEGGEVDTANPAVDYINACQNLRGPIVDINNGVDKQVDLIISAHSHQAYNCMLTDPAGQPRLVTQAGFYGRLVTDIRLTINSVSGEVDRTAETYGATNVPVEYQKGEVGDQEVADIVRYWKDRAAVAGSVVVGRQADDLDRAYRQGTAVRDRESSLGNLIADAQLASANAPGSVLGGADLAIMNPGGIRADLNCLAPAGSTQQNGDITYAETFAVQPFSNTVNAVDLTGAAIDQILEEQWSVRGGSLSFLHLAVSGNVTYRFDPNAPVGQRIDPATVLIDNAPLDVNDVYRVAANSFLIGGGDSFFGFRDGRANGSTPVTGPNDVDAFNAYLATAGTVTPPALTRAVPTDGSTAFDSDGSGDTRPGIC